MGQIFISYKREEIEFANRVKNKLEAEGFSVWMDTTNLRGGNWWREEIDRAIRESIALIAIMTPQAAQSTYVTYEWSFACGAEVSVIPVIFERVKLHSCLKDLHYRDFTGAPPWNDLVDDLKIVQSHQLTIHHAVWGAEDSMRDVTAIVQNQISSGKLLVLTDSGVTGDSLP